MRRGIEGVHRRSGAKRPARAGRSIVPDRDQTRGGQSRPAGRCRRERDRGRTGEPEGQRSSVARAPPRARRRRASLPTPSVPAMFACAWTAAHASDTVSRAVEERARAGRDRVPMRVESTPDRYVSGEETALVHWLNGGEAKPTSVPPRPFERGVRRPPDVGPERRDPRALGTHRSSRCCVVSFTGNSTRSGHGTLHGRRICRSGRRVRGAFRLRRCDHCSRPLAPRWKMSRGVLVGGYFGTWLSPSTISTYHPRLRLTASCRCVPRLRLGRHHTDRRLRPSRAGACLPLACEPERRAVRTMRERVACDRQCGCGPLPR